MDKESFKKEFHELLIKYQVVIGISQYNRHPIVNIVQLKKDGFIIQAIHIGPTNGFVE